MDELGMRLTDYRVTTISISCIPLFFKIFQMRLFILLMLLCFTISSHAQDNEAGVTYDF